MNSKYKKISNRTRSIRNESIINQVLNLQQIELSPTETLLLDGRDTEVAFEDFVFALKGTDVDFHDKFYTKLDATGINPQKEINNDVKSKDRWS